LSSSLPPTVSKKLDLRP